MKNQNIPFNTTVLSGHDSRRPAAAGLLTRLLLAFLAAVIISAPTPAVANGHDDEDLPFKGTVSGTIPADIGPPLPGTGGCVFSFTVPNSGNGNHLGAFTGSANFVPNLCDGSYTGTFNWAAANGDRISGTFLGQQIPTATAGVFYNLETAVITGGTGRFRHATGMFTLYGQLNFNTGTFVLPWSGTISLDRH